MVDLGWALVVSELSGERVPGLCARDRSRGGWDLGESSIQYNGHGTFNFPLSCILTLVIE
jgi:hypothetical protein